MFVPEYSNYVFHLNKRFNMYPSLLKQAINYREKCRNYFLIDMG